MLDKCKYIVLCKGVGGGLLGGFNIHECGISCLGVGEEEFVYCLDCFVVFARADVVDEMVIANGEDV